MTRLNPIEHKILKVLIQRRVFMSTREIARRARVSWNTAFVYLNRFYNRGWLSRKKVGNRIYWKARVR
ncbi:MAG: hypothetical protein J7L39_01260 [Candidatus Aenigmarchaeota archaeon]|nr:hypothetical protein [Candidatus Aenigmarchaeota archaeon]